ncbi:hypothetical protein CC78DRAFT_616160 [Lojkania enalia]|uniref:Uncharacterized protein n=1 Tax=Lojkania enalia TaxID=147567 RepID=A0A9P4N466_9PLEO|nr:hypothetical protein CC78DRAFT_616160 [Didymosphaeria enalia]
MNWARDNTGLSEIDLSKVFKYEPRETTVIRLLASTDWRTEIYSYETEKQWYDFIENKIPSISGDDSGLVLLVRLAKRSGEPTSLQLQKTFSDDWIEKANKKPVDTRFQRADTLARLEEKAQVPESNSRSNPANGRRSVRTVPFSKPTFERVTRAFHIHGSVARVISRADVPVFNCEKVHMRRPATVYHCRSSNAWEMDLALTTTHFPETELTFAILFGCPFSIEKEVITRLSEIRKEASHPLLLPGIFAEIERNRHVSLVDEMGNEVETKIFELDFQSSDLEGPQGANAEEKSRNKRTAYLDLAYLRNALVSWNTQLAKMVRHAQDLINADIYGVREHLINPLDSYDKPIEDAWADVEAKMAVDIDSCKHPWNFQSQDQHRDQGDPLRNISYMVKQRLMAIRDEYDDKIRDCTMRVDGMAMATQWAHGETNVEIALATNRDSRHMRSIALVTMIFLPGTFFASMFSMTFFNWSNDAGTPIVSTYLWIYVLITVFFTALTIGLWYYVVIWRPSHKRMRDEEDVNGDEKRAAGWQQSYPFRMMVRLTRSWRKGP